LGLGSAARDEHDRCKRKRGPINAMHDISSRLNEW
jgi:hypothetical protein